MCHLRSVRNQTGASKMAELAAAIVVIFPILITIVYMAIEAAQAYTITSALAVAAERAARQVAINYGQNPSGTIASQTSVFNSITFLNIVNSGSQFSIPAGTAGWNTASNPPTVTVTCTYQSGQHGLAPFPNPDPLNLGGSFVLASSATCRLE